MEDLRLILAKLIKMYGEAKGADSSDIKNLYIYKSPIYAMKNVYSFTYKDIDYFVVDDYSLNDDPNLVENVIKSVVGEIIGSVLRNTTPQSDGAIYASGLSGVEYYLWKCV